MRFVIYSLLTYLLVISYTSTAQKQASLWYFGRNNGLDFTTIPPKIVTDGALSTTEGCATIADKDGRLLFYTDGMTVWDRTHKQMPNGQNLKGHYTSTQSAIIIPKPGNESIYYIFTADEGGYESHPNSGIHYSEVNMCLNKGLGDVVEKTKNTFLYKLATERLSAVFHANRTDVWVMTHEWGSNRFLAYLISEQGVSEQPVISHSGSVHEYLLENRIGYSNTIGEMKFSPNGKRLALAVQGQNLVQVFNFDATSGIISNPITLSEASWANPMLKPYGISFSANSKLLYVGASEDRKLYQFNLEAGSAQDICESRYSMDTEKLHFYSIYGLQLALDGKIYVNQPNEDATFAGIIHDPNKPGQACRFNSQEINPGNALRFYSWACFPNFISSYFDPAPYISYQKACENDLYHFSIQNDLAVKTVEWQFDDRISSERNQSTKLAPEHQFSKPGIYLVHARVSLQDGSMQELEKKVIVFADFSLGKDTLLCASDSLTLDVSSQQGIYRWQDGSSEATFTVKKSGIYWVDICTNGCSKRYMIQVTYEQPLDVYLGADQIICDDKPVQLNAATQLASLYKWQDGSTNPNFIASESGTYYVTVNSKCFQAADTITLLYKKAPDLVLGENLSLCVGDTAYLDASSIYANSYKWFTSADATPITSQSSLAITQAGTYIVEARNESCITTDTIEVIVDECDKNLFIPNVITPNGDGMNDHFTVKGILEGKWTIAIYTRQGRIIYQSDKYSNDWNGENIPYSSLYFYHLYNPSSKRFYKGWLQVLR